ncbi:MAG: hypothetical protein ABFD61_07355 [Chloroherpetonaceae bacterium]
MKKFSVIFVLSFVFCNCFSYSQPSGQIRVAVLPFENADGRMEFNTWSYKIQDSLTKYLKARDSEEYNYCVVPMDSIEAVLAEMNIDPTSPEYESDMWKAVEKLKCSRVIMGNFNVRGGKFLINCYIYIVDYKLADPRYQVKDIFKDMDKIYEAVPEIGNKLRPALLEKTQ